MTIEPTRCRVRFLWWSIWLWWREEYLPVERFSQTEKRFQFHPMPCQKGGFLIHQSAQKKQQQKAKDLDTHEFYSKPFRVKMSSFKLDLIQKGCLKIGRLGDSMLWFDTVCKSEQNGTAPENATYPPCISPSAPRVGATWLILTLYPSIIPVNSNVLKTFNHFEFLAHLSTQMRRTICSSSKRPQNEPSSSFKIMWSVSEEEQPTRGRECRSNEEDGPLNDPAGGGGGVEIWLPL